jgi:hypothetical protein
MNTTISHTSFGKRWEANRRLDPRPLSGAQGYNPWPVFDEKRRAVPPFELACFSSLCMQAGAIVRVIATKLCLSNEAYQLVLTRGDEPVGFDVLNVGILRRQVSAKRLTAVD